MTTSIDLAPQRSPADQASGSTIRVTQARLIRSEWIKFRSVRSTPLTMAFVSVAVIAVGVLVSALTSGTGLDPDATIVDPTASSLAGTNLAQLALGVLGALLFTTEYSTGLIRATLTAAPKRLGVLWAKVAVLGSVSFAVVAGSVVTAFIVGQAVLGGDGAGASLSDPGVVRALIGAAFYPTAIAILGLSLGAIMRQTAGAIGVLFGVLFLAPFLIQSLGGFWVDVASYLPSEAGSATTSIVANPELLSPMAGFAVLLSWMAVALTSAAVLLRRRDA